MTDVIRICELCVPTRVGVTPEERAHLQKVVVNIDIRTDLSRPGASDELADTLDYDRATREVAALIRGTESKLLEHLAEKIAAVLAAFDGVDGVTVDVAKEAPPIPEDVGAVAVRIERDGHGRRRK